MGLRDGMEQEVVCPPRHNLAKCLQCQSHLCLWLPGRNVDLGNETTKHTSLPASCPLARTTLHTGLDQGFQLLPCLTSFYLKFSSEAGAAIRVPVPRGTAGCQSQAAVNSSCQAGSALPVSGTAVVLQRERATWKKGEKRPMRQLRCNQGLSTFSVANVERPLRP